MTFPKNTDLAAVRLELASAIRNIYPSFPAGVTYPVISHGVGGTRSETSLSYLIKGSLPSLEIEKYTREHILPALADVKGVDNVGLYGATPFQWVITYDPDKLQSAGLKPDDIASAFRQRYDDNLVGMSETDGQVMAIRLALKGDDDFGIKRDIVENDEFDTGERMLLNFGHTLGHAIEKLYNYTGITHGSAVAVGMCMITEMSENLGITEAGTLDRLKKCVEKYSLPTECKFSADELKKHCVNDKKRSGKTINLVICTKTGASAIKRVDIEKFCNGEM